MRGEPPLSPIVLTSSEAEFVLSWVYVGALFECWASEDCPLGIAFLWEASRVLRTLRSPYESEQSQGREKRRNADHQAAVLQRVIMFDGIDRHLTIPILVQQLIEDGADSAEGSDLERAVRDLDRAGLLCCRRGRVYPTSAGFRARGEAQAGNLAALKHSCVDDAHPPVAGLGSSKGTGAVH